MQVLFIVLGIALFASAIALADDNNTNSAIDYVRLNTSTDATIINEVYAGGDVGSYSYINTNGSVDVYINGNNVFDETRWLRNETGQMVSYILDNQGSWSQDSEGIDMDDLIKALSRISEYKNGKSTYLSDRDKAILYYLESIYQPDTISYIANSLAPRDVALETYHETIQRNIYEIEALYRTFEKIEPEVYCRSRLEVAEKYNLTTVKCGLHSKICYNGNLNPIEDGRDFCVHTDNDIDYLPCINTLGRCGRIISVSVQESEENSFIPVILTYSNPGLMNLSPSVRVELQNIDSNIIAALTEKPMGIIEPGQERTIKILLDTANVTAGKYELWVTAISGRKEILQKLEYNILEEGSIGRAGEIHISSIEPIDYSGVEIKGSYKNTNDRPYAAQINAKFYASGKIEDLDTLESRVYIEPGETKEFRFTYGTNVSGDYDAIISVAGTGLVEKFNFTVASKPKVSEASMDIIGNFMLAAPQVYTAVMVAAILLAMFLALKLFRRASRGKSTMKKELI